MQPLGPGALGEIFDDAAGHAAGDAERINDLFGVEAERSSHSGRRTHRAEDRGRVKTGLVDGLRHHETQTAQHLGTDGDADQRHAAVGIVPLAGRQNRRHHYRAGMHRTAFKCVVEILAMRRGAVDEGRSGGGQHARVTDHRARAVIVPARQRTGDVILVARGGAEADHVDQQILAFAHGRVRQAIRPQCHDFPGQRFGDRGFRQFGCHFHQIKRGRSCCSAT